ncbi:cell envelope integrity protein CreD [Qipengyuania sp. JC766]|uniref:cell envelope integrity protein CreD n=1 Tax=Qipengyuania sp. JC766 TaxID=3232139 RepID=UPI00345ACBB1
MVRRNPGTKLALVGLVGFVLMIPLLMVYGLVGDREAQSRTAQDAISQGWAGPQTMTGPMLVIPYETDTVETETMDGRKVSRTVRRERELFVSPQSQSVRTTIAPELKGYAIYRTAVYEAAVTGEAVFTVPDEIERLGIAREALQIDRAELRFGVTDTQGLIGETMVQAGNGRLALNPGNGPAATDGSGFSTALSWNGEGTLPVRWSLSFNGTRSLAFVPRGGRTQWQVTSPWQHPSFVGSFLPGSSDVSADGFDATYEGITNLALGEPIVSTEDRGPPAPGELAVGAEGDRYEMTGTTAHASTSKVAAVRLVEPVDIYSQVERSVKYGFLFIGFTFLVYLMFDVVAGARVASVEYLLTGAGLVLFFVMLLGFAEHLGFAFAYLIASAAIIGLLTTYSVSVLGGWRRAGMVGGMLAGLYATLYVLLSLEAFALLVGSLLLFVALAAVMFATRNVDWSAARDAMDEGRYTES